MLISDNPHGRASLHVPAVAAPWTRTWLYRAPGETATLLWIAGLHIAVAIGLWVLPFPGWTVVAIALVFCALGGLGTTVAYHRALAHRALKLNPVVEQLLVFWAMFNGSGNPLTWVANHRYHHAHSDTQRDVSSPRQGGFWWAHLRWLWQAEQASPTRYCPELVRRGFSLWGRMQVPILALSVAGGMALWPLLGGWNALAVCLWLGPVRLLIALHVQASVNSVCHLGSVTTEHGSSKNVWWLAPMHMFQGENWHANHHRSQNNARLGRTWWQIDTAWWFIVCLQRVALARVSRTSAFRDAARRRERSLS